MTPAFGVSTLCKRRGPDDEVEDEDANGTYMVQQFATPARGNRTQDAAQLSPAETYLLLGNRILNGTPNNGYPSGFDNLSPQKAERPQPAPSMQLSNAGGKGGKKVRNQAQKTQGKKPVVSLADHLGMPDQPAMPPAAPPLSAAAGMPPWNGFPQSMTAPPPPSWSPAVQGVSPLNAARPPPLLPTRERNAPIARRVAPDDTMQGQRERELSSHLFVEQQAAQMKALSRYGGLTVDATSFSEYPSGMRMTQDTFLQHKDPIFLGSALDEAATATPASMKQSPGSRLGQTPASVASRASLSIHVPSPLSPVNPWARTPSPATSPDISPKWKSSPAFIEVDPTGTCVEVTDIPRAQSPGRDELPLSLSPKSHSPVRRWDRTPTSCSPERDWARTPSEALSPGISPLPRQRAWRDSGPHERQPASASEMQFRLHGIFGRQDAGAEPSQPAERPWPASVDPGLLQATVERLHLHQVTQADH